MTSSSISIDPIFLVTNECIHITSAMRKNARWAQSSMASILGVPPSSSTGGSGSGSETSRLGLRTRKGLTTVSFLFRMNQSVSLMWVGQSVDLRVCKVEIGPRRY